MITNLKDFKALLTMKESVDNETDLVPLIDRFVKDKDIDIVRTNDDDIEELAKEFKAKYPNVKDSLLDINYSIRSMLGMGYPEPKKEPEGEPEYYSRSKNYKTSHGDTSVENNWLYRRLTMPVHPGYLWYEKSKDAKVMPSLIKNYFSVNTVGILSGYDLERMLGLKWDNDHIYRANENKSIIVWTSQIHGGGPVMLYFKYSVDYTKFKNTCRRFIELLPNDNGQYLGIHLRYPYGLEPHWDHELKGKVKKVL